MRLSNADILRLIPEFMRNDEAVAGLATAVNKLIRELGERVNTMRVWDQIDNLSEDQLDELAYELDIDWYSAGMPIENKREAVRTSDLVHMRRGTKWGVEQLIAASFARGYIVEWFEEGYVNPKPFHFSVYTSHRNVTDEIMREFRTSAAGSVLARARLDSIFFSDVYGSKMVVSKIESVHLLNSKKTGNNLVKCGTHKCGG